MYCALIDFGTPEFDEAMQLRHEVLHKPLNLVYSPEEIAEEYKEFHIGCYDQQSLELLGVLTLKPISESVIKMRQVAISIDKQSKGIGTFLVKDSEIFSKKKGFTKIELSARMAAVPFYKKNEYDTEGEKFVEVGIDHYNMYKNL